MTAVVTHAVPEGTFTQIVYGHIRDNNLDAATAILQQEWQVRKCQARAIAHKLPGARWRQRK